MSVVGSPGFIVSGGAAAVSAFVVMSRRAVACWRAGQIRQVRLFPGLPWALHQGFIGGVVQPGMPLGRHAGCLRRTGIGHPAANAVTGAGTPLFVVRIAVGVGADAPAIEHSEQPGAEVHVARYTKLLESGPPGPCVTRSSTGFCGPFVHLTQNRLSESRWRS